jgi:cytochrome P450
MTDTDLPQVDDLEALAHPQPMFKLLRDAGPAVHMEDMDMYIVGGDDDVREVLHNTAIYSSVDAVDIGQIRPLIPLMVDPPEHRNYRKLLDPLFAPKRIALLEDRTREIVKGLVSEVADAGHCNFHQAIAEPLPSTVFLQLLGLPVSRAPEFIKLKDGIIRPPAKDDAERRAMTHDTGTQIYAVLEEVLAERVTDPQDDFISLFLEAEVDGHRLTHDDILDIGFLFFIAGLDTVTSSLDCMLAHLAQHPEHRQQLVDEPDVIPHAVEEMLRWESPVQGVIRRTTEDTVLNGCPIPKGRQVSVLLGSANTDERAWERPDEVDFHREVNKHIAFGGGAHRCLGSHLARMELRVALEEWHLAVPEYRLPEGIELRYSQGLRSIDNLELIW